MKKRSIVKRIREYTRQKANFTDALKSTSQRNYRSHLLKMGRKALSGRGFTKHLYKHGMPHF